MELRVPAEITEAAAERVRELARARLPRSAAAAGLARCDFFVDGETVLVNELNTIPGFTETSVYGKLLEASGIAYAELVRPPGPARARSAGRTRRLRVLGGERGRSRPASGSAPAALSSLAAW